ncbi:MAG: hypothetical protein K0B87_06770 [Candidatus Syntrophosphaera sp.]|nr:hypothetical protein [Candidatus Syntrophosphaera sp.]
MATSTRRRIRAIAIFVIFIALAYAGFTTFLHKAPVTDTRLVFRDADTHFRNTGSLNKAKVIVRSASIAKALEAVNGIVNSYALGKPLLKDVKSNYGIFIFKIDGSMFNTVLGQLAEAGNIEEHKEIVDSVLVVKRLATEEAILANKRNELAGMDRNGDRVMGSLTDAKNQLIDEIRKLETTVDILRQSETTLLYIQLVTSTGGKNVSVIRQFAQKFGLALVILFIGTILLYYGAKLLMYLLSLLGVKGFGLGNLGGGTPYGYGNYANRYYHRHGYGANRRKVKRIYKGKPSAPQGDGEDQNTDDNQNWEKP